MVKMFLGGARVEDVCAEFGCSVPTVAAALRAHGVPARRGPGSVRRSQRKEHVKLCKDCDEIRPVKGFNGRVCAQCTSRRQMDARRKWIASLDFSRDDHLLQYLQRIMRTSLMRDYGLTPEEAFEWYKRRVCDVCGKLPSGRRKLNDLDHCHRTGKIRGLLCSHHNRFLGFIDEEPETLDAMVRYLARARDMT